MDEVALISSEQQKFQKSVKGIKNLLKSGKIKPRTDKDAKLARFPKREKKQKKKRGLVYISHIPHGFYENEMTQYFRQFGVVTNVRVLRSPRTGRSKGAAFVEFLEPAVAEIVAQTMNNYLMGKRLLKAELVPPEKQKTRAMRKNWNTQKNPGSDARLKMKKILNEDGTHADDIKLARKQIKNVIKTKAKLKDLGIDYDFFEPVEVPVELSDTNKSQPLSKPTESQKKENMTEIQKAKIAKPTAENKKKVEAIKTKVVEKTKIEKENTKPLAKQHKGKDTVDTSENLKVNKKNEKQNNVQNKKENKKVLDKKETNHKVLSEKQASKHKKQAKFEGQDFIEVNQDEVKSDKSDDSNDEFDSDAFEMTIDSDDDDFDSDDQASDDDGSDAGGNSDDEDGSDSSDEEPPKKATKVQNISKKAPVNKQKEKQVYGVTKGAPKRKLEANVSNKKFAPKQQKKNKK